MQYPTPYSTPPAGYTGELSDMLTYMFKQTGWEQKILAGAGISLVPILNFASTGYMLDVMERVRTNSQPPLPDWSENLGKYFTDGLMLVVINLIYSIPAVVLWFLGFGAIFGTSMMSDNAEAVGTVSVLVGIVLMALLFAYAVVLFFWAQGVIVNYSLKRTFASGFEFGPIWNVIQKGWKRMLLVVALSIGFGIVIGIVATILNLIPCLGQIVSFLIGLPAGFYLVLVTGYNAGFIAREVHPA
jgi:hypothetical protein